MDSDQSIRFAVYQHFAETGSAPDPQDVARRVDAEISDVTGAYPRLAAARALVFEEDGIHIRMALPFSGVATEHVVESGGVRYYANCAWDTLGIPAVLNREAVVHSRCAYSQEVLRLHVEPDGPRPSTWLFHSLVPAARWWDDIVFT